MIRNNMCLCHIIVHAGVLVIAINCYATNELILIGEIANQSMPIEVKLAILHKKIASGAKCSGTKCLGGEVSGGEVS